MKSGDIYTKINNICRAKSPLLRRFIGSQNISLKKKNRWSFKGLQSIYTKKRACSAYVVKYLRYNYSSNWILNLHAGYANMRPSCVCAALGQLYYCNIQVLGNFKLLQTFFLHKHSSDKIKIENKYEPGWYFSLKIDYGHFINKIISE